jgi:hypothetical protein
MLERLRAVTARARHFKQLLTQPYERDRDAALARVWDTLPDNLKVPKQSFGTQNPGCAATYNIMERCDFSCTACYLSKEANWTPALPLDEVKRQLDAIRAFLGPWGNTQITAGEVTLMPVEDLVEIVRYCHQIQLSAMVMTHGDTFRKDPSYLRRLVLEGQLQKVAIHVDTTQRGRMGEQKGATEADLHPLRDEFAAMVKATREETGRTLHAAHTFTIDEQNFQQVPEVMRWVLANADAFRMISFQPTAEVGRTRTEKMTGRREAIWDKICEGVGQHINPQQFFFGHPDCNNIALMFVVRFGDEQHVVEVTREHAVDEAWMQRLLNSAVVGFSPDGEAPLDQLARLLGRVAREPQILAEAAAFCAFRAFTERAWLPRLLATIARGEPWQLNPFVIVVHHFMSKQELQTQRGQERLAACTFRLPVGDRMVSMCEMNGTDLRLQLNREATHRLGGGAPPRKTRRKASPAAPVHRAP